MADREKPRVSLRKQPRQARADGVRVVQHHARVQRAQGAYVGPLAAVLGGTVGASARIEDHATIVAGTVSGGTVGGLTVLETSATISGSAKVQLAWPYGPAWFEKPQTISGSAVMLGDLELRGANQGESSGTYCGFVDDTVMNNCTPSDVTAAPPYAWRP